MGLLPSQEDLAELYNKASIGLVFNTTNPSMTPFEMMACGLPVVDLDFNNNHINYGGKKNAMLVDPFPENIAEGIIKLLKNEKLRNKISQNGYSYVSNFPDKNKVFDTLEEIIKKEVSNAHLKN